jgi:hypothetical protein
MKVKFKKCKECKEQFLPQFFNQKFCFKESCRRLNYSKKKINKISEKRSLENKEYLKIRKQYLINNPNCEICNSNNVEIHHKKGRIGKLLFDDRYFMTVCREHHNYIHTNPKEAREKKWML